MEQTIIDFFAKSSELILHNRLLTNKSLEAALNKITNPNLYKFQLNFNQNFNFSGKIPSQWNIQSNRLLVLEFFLRRKNSEEKILVEQWIFELNQVSDSKLKDTVDSQNTLYKKLSILLRTISLLTVTLPLYKSFVADKSNPLHEHYTLEHSINFTRHSLSNWHSSIHEENNYASFSNPDLVLPGRTFSFKVAYPKSLNFLQNLAEGSTQRNQNRQLELLKQKLDMNYFSSIGKDRTSSDEFLNAFQRTRKNTADSHKNLTSMTQMSSKDQQQFLGSEGFSDNASPFGSLLTSSPIETQGSPAQTSERRPRKSSAFFGDLTRNTPGNRPRFATMESEKSGEYEMYLYEDAEGKFTEVLTESEMDGRTESPRKFSLHPKTNEDELHSQGTSRKFSIQEMKLSINAKPIEKIIEQSDDDKLAEIFQVVEELKEHYYKPLEISKKKMVTSSSVQKGFKFQRLEDQKNGESNKELPTLSSDFESFKKLYSELKR